MPAPRGRRFAWHLATPLARSRPRGVGNPPRVVAGGHAQTRTAASSPKASRRTQSNTERRRRRASIWFLVMRPTPSSPAEGGVITRSSHARTLRVDMRCSIGHAHGEPSCFLLIRRTPGEKLMSPAHFQRRASGQVAAGTHTLCNEPREDTMREPQRARISFLRVRPAPRSEVRESSARGGRLAERESPRASKRRRG